MAIVAKSSGVRKAVAHFEFVQATQDPDKYRLKVLRQIPFHTSVDGEGSTPRFEELNRPHTTCPDPGGAERF